MTQEQIVNDMKSYLHSDVGYDYIMLIEGLGVIGKITSNILGLFIVILTLGIPLIVAIEVMYINFPIMQLKINNFYNRLEGKANKALGVVLRDAMWAVELSKTEEYGKSANLIYLRLKCKVIFLSVFLIALTIGPGHVLIIHTYNIVSGIIDGLISVLP